MARFRWSRLFAVRPVRPRRDRASPQLHVEVLEDRTVLAGNTLADATPIALNGLVADGIGAAGETDWFRFTIEESGRLSVLTDANPDTRTSLLGPDGELLIQSDGQSAGNRADLIDQHLLAGTYFVIVEGPGGGTGVYTLTTAFLPATSPLQPVPVPFPPAAAGALSPHFAATGDFNGDGRLDLATANTYPLGTVSVMLGVGDGAFQAARNFTVGSLPFGIVAGDFNRDGHLDLATANQGSSDISVLLNRGDGTFAPEVRNAGGTGGWELDTTDLNGDGFLDLVSANVTSRDISVLLGRGDGTFRYQRHLALGTPVYYVGFGDFNGDGRLDLAAGQGPEGVSLLLGRGDGTFQEPSRLIVTGEFFFDVATGDFNGDGRLDLAVTNIGGSDLGLFLGRGDGTFQSPQRWATGPFANGLVAADFNGDGRLDLAVANRGSNDVSLLLGRGDGTFQDQVRFAVGLQPWDLLLGDFNGDGRTDLAAANAQSHDFTLLLGLGDGTFEQNPLRRAGADNSRGVVTADFNGDGQLDLATTSYAGDDLSVFLGRGDGTFHGAMRFPVGSTPVFLMTADFDGDGRLDLATVNCTSNDVSILLGRGDGTFTDQGRYATGIGLEFGVAGDFNGDAKLDLFVGGLFGNRGVVLLGRGDGTFAVFAERILFTADLPSVFTVGDFDGDGRLDLAATHVNSPTISAYLGLDPTDAGSPGVSVYLGRGDGRFQAPQRFAVGNAPRGIVTGDFNGDGRLDLATANAGAQSVSLLLGRGDGTFRDEARFSTGASSESLVAADLNGDGFLDLAVTGVSARVTVLLGRGDGAFQAAVPFALGDKPSPHIGIVAGDFNGDGRLDLATPQVLTNDVAVLRGSGDGTFQALPHLGVGFGPAAVVTGDFNGDGRLDVAAAHPGTNDLAVAVGKGDATLQDAVRFAVGRTPTAVLRADFNRDGRLDLAAANFGSNDVSVLLGLGDGTFRPEQRFAAGTNPTGLVTGDFDGDGRPDLAVTNAGSDDVSLLRGRGDGTFHSPVNFAAGDLPQALTAGDFNADGFLDLAVANYGSQDVALFLGRGNGAFQDPVRLALGTAPISLTTADFDGDGRLDLVTANYRSNDVSVLLGHGNGTFGGPVRFEAGTNPLAVTAGDFDGDGRLDLATVNNTSHDAALLKGRGDGTFGGPVRRAVGKYPGALVGADFDGDGRLDLAVGTQLVAEVSIHQGMGDLTFVDGGTLSSPLRAEPLVADWNGDGVTDVAVVDREGKILLRLARPGAHGVFEAPLVLNPEPHFAARDLALVSDGENFLVAALDVRSSTVCFYARGPNGTFIRSAGLAIPGTLLVGLAAGDLDGDGRTDLVVAAAGSSQVLVYLRDAAGGFGPTPDHVAGVGVSPSAIKLSDVDGDGRPDIVVTNQFSGDVSVLRNERGAPFAHELRFRAGTGLYGVDTTPGRLTVRSRQAPAGIVVGQFDADGIPDLIVTLNGSNSFALLHGSDTGGFLNPGRAGTYLTGFRPTVVVSGLFNDDPYLDLAVLNEGSADLSIFLGDGRGGFQKPGSSGATGVLPPLSAGNLPTGLSTHDVNGDGNLDLLVGNDFGDVLTLLGNGDGTFRPYQRAGRGVALAIADVNNDGLDDFIFANEARDRVSVEYSAAGQTYSQERDDGVLAPGAVSTADLNRDGWADLIVANSGGNNVLVYLAASNGQFAAARSFFTGTNPAGLTVRDLNGDNLLDLAVANEGSNDVTVLFGLGSGAGWDLEPGPRLSAGTAPVSTVVQEVTGDGFVDILVTNRQSNDVFLLPGVGSGFFNDQAPVSFATGLSPRQSFVGNFDAFAGIDLVTVNSGSNNLTFFSNFTTPSFGGVSFSSGGLAPVAAVAGDFNADGFSDLLVAHNGDGAISLLFGQSGGLALRTVGLLGNLLHPTALALGSLEFAGFGGFDNTLEVFVVGEDSEVVRRLTLSFEFGPIGLPPSTGGSGFGQNGPGQVSDLLPLRDSAVAIVATLLTVRLDSETLTGRSANQPARTADDAGFLEGVFALLDAHAQGGSEDEGEASGDEEMEGRSERTDALLKFVTGHEEALERRSEATREDLLGPGRGLLSVADGLTALLNDLGEVWQALCDNSPESLAASVRGLRTLVETVAREKVALPDLPLREVVEDLSRGLLKAWRIVADEVDTFFAMPQPEKPQGPMPDVERPALPSPEDDPCGLQSPTDEDAPALEGESAPSLPLLMAFFAGGFSHPPRAMRRCRRRPG